MSDDFLRDLRPIKNAEQLQELSEISGNSKVTDTDLSLIKGLNSKRVECLKELGITSATALLLQGRTAQMRKIIAQAIIRSENIRPTDKAVERYCRYVLSWVRQADLWRVNGMDPDTAYALVMLGVRHVEDLAKVDGDKVFTLIDSMRCTMPELDEIDREALADLITAAGAMSGTSSAHQSILRRKLKDSLSLTGKRLPLGMDRTHAKLLLELLGGELMELCAGDLFGSVGMVESDDPAPLHLMRSGGIVEEEEQLQVPTAVSINKIKSGLEAMKKIPKQLRPPRYIRGRVYMLRPGDEERSKLVLSDALVELDGTVTPNGDSTEKTEKPHGYTDGNGEFVIELPAGSNLCQTMTLTVSQGSRKQNFQLSADTVLMSCPERKILADLDELDRIHEQLLADEAKLDKLKGSGEAPLSQEEQVFYETYRGKEEALREEIRLANERMEALADQIRSSDPGTNDLVQILNHLTSREDITADLRGTPFVVNESVFNRLPTDQPKVLPSVKLMEHEDEPVYLPTDTAPSQIFQYSMLQRLVEPDIRKNGKDQHRIAVNDALDVAAFKRDLAGNHDRLPYMSSLGMGYSLNMHQAWVPDGFALGTLLYSLVLAPGEEQRLVVRENKLRYGLTDQAAGVDGVSESYALDQIDNAEAAFHAAMEQMISASASFSTSSKSWSLGGTGGVGGFSTDGGGSFGFGGGLAGGIGSASSKGNASSSQTNTHSEASNAAQTFQHGIKMASEKISQAKRLSISMATSDQKDSVATRIIANHNHSHTMTIQYWEVMRRYRLATCVDSVDLVLFVPLKPIAFYGAQQTSASSTRPAATVPRPEEGSTSTRPAVTVRRPEEVSTSTRPAVTVPRPELGNEQENSRICMEFREKYETVMAHYDVLARALPVQYRAGLEVIRTYSLMEGWKPEDIRTDAGQLTVSFEGSFLKCDRLNARLVLKNGKGVVGGQVILHRTQLDDMLQTTEQVCEAIRSVRSMDVVRPDPDLEQISSRMIFDLPAGTSLADIGSIDLSYSCDPMSYVLHRRPADLASNDENAYEVFAAMWHKMWDRAKDDDDSENDERRIEFYKNILPEAWISPNITIPPQKLRSLGPVSVRITDVQLGATTLRHSISTTDVSAGAKLSIYAPTDILTRADQLKADETYRHILANTMRYSQAVWASLTIDERAMLLDQYTIHMDWEDDNTQETDIPLLNCINVHKLLGFYGNCMLFPFTYPENLAKQIGRTAAELQDTLYRYHSNNFRVPVTTISLPTDGMIGEAVLGATNVSEEIDLTRFWNWKDSPIDNMSIDSSYLNGTDYLKDKKTKDLTALNLTGVTQPTNMPIYDALKELLGRENPEFENLTGMDQLKELVSGATEVAASGRDKAMDTAQESMKGVLDFTHNMKKADNERIKTLLENGYTPDGEYNKEAAQAKGKGQNAAGAKPAAGSGGGSGAGTSASDRDSGSVNITIYNGSAGGARAESTSNNNNSPKPPEKPKDPTDENRTPDHEPNENQDT